MRTLLTRINPLTKVIIMIAVIIPVTFSYDIFFPLSMLLLVMIGTALFSEVSIPRSIVDLRLIALSSTLLAIFFMVNRGMANSSSWVPEPTAIDIQISISIGLRMFLFAYLSYVFIKTTEPVELTMSLVHQLRVRPEIAYAFLVAYRFAPNFKEEFDRVRMAYEARGIVKSDNPVSSVLNMRRYLIPLIINAIRQGEKIGIAMDIRGLGAHSDRTYYHETHFRHLDWAVATVFTLLVVLLVGGQYLMGSYRFGLGLR